MNMKTVAVTVLVGVAFTSQTASGGPPPTCPASLSCASSAPQKSVLIIKDDGGDGASANDKFIWKWIGGSSAQIDFGDPVASTGYALCVYDDSGTNLKLEIQVPAGGGWTPISDKGYLYKDPSSGTDGISLIKLKGSSVAGKAKILMKGKGSLLPLTSNTLPFYESTFQDDVLVSLMNGDNSICWLSIVYEDTGPYAWKNTPELFKQKYPH